MQGVGVGVGVGVGTGLMVGFGRPGAASYISCGAFSAQPQQERKYIGTNPTPPLHVNLISTSEISMHEVMRSRGQSWRNKGCGLVMDPGEWLNKLNFLLFEKYLE